MYNAKITILEIILPPKQLHESPLDLLVPQAVDHRVQHGDDHGVNTEAILSVSKEWLELGCKYMKMIVP